MRRLGKFSIISGLVALAIALAGIVATSNDSFAQKGKPSEGSSDGLSRPHVGF